MSSWDVVLTDAQKAYFAGLFDGEGTVYLRKQTKCDSYALTVSVMCGTHQKSMFQFCRMFGKRAEPINGNGKKRTAWRLRLHSQQALRFLEQIEPYACIKQEQVQLAIKFQRRKRRGPKINDELRQIEQHDKDQLTRLNKRGL